MMRCVGRTLAVFDCFTAQRMSLTLQEIADGIDLPKSTAFRIVHSLEQLGYLIRLEDQKYCLSFRFTRLAGLVMSTLGIRQVARPMMFELQRRTNETVTLNVASGRDRTCIDVIDTPAPLMSLARPGQHVPLDHTGATAKTLMAHMAAGDQEKLVGLAAKAKGRTRAAIASELARVRRDGYCVSHGERVLGLSAISAPVWDGSEAAPYCVTITAPTVRLKPRIGEFVPLLLGAAREISRRLGADRDGLDPPVVARKVAPARTRSRRESTPVRR